MNVVVPWIAATDTPTVVLAPCTTPGCTDLAFVEEDENGEETTLCDACQDWQEWRS